MIPMTAPTLNARDRFLAACHAQPVDRPPVWLMRQAGRYLPEYRALKAKHDFLTLVRTPELALEVTLQPLQRYALDAAILFSDILVIPEALGQPYHFRDEGGIGMDFTLTADRIDGLASPEEAAERLEYVYAALRLIKKTLHGSHALLGFAGSPWTLAAYMVEGGSSQHFEKLKALAYGDRPTFERLMARLADTVALYCRAQVEAGADAIQLFDSWASLCPADDYNHLSLQWIERIIAALPAGFPVIVFAKGMSHHAAAIARAGARVVGLDWTVSMKELHPKLPAGIAVQGNIDPILLNTTPELVRSAVRRLLDGMTGLNGFIVNLGHGILPGAKPENVAAFVDAVVEGDRR